MYLSTITQDGKTLLIEADDIIDVQPMQPLNIGGNRICYLVIISYRNGTKEQTVIEDAVWKWWNSDERKKQYAERNK